MSTRGRAFGALGIVVAAALLVWAGFAFIGAHDTESTASGMLAIHLRQH